MLTKTVSEMVWMGQNLYHWPCWGKGKSKAVGLMDPITEVYRRSLKSGPISPEEVVDVRVIGFKCSDCGYAKVFVGMGIMLEEDEDDLRDGDDEDEDEEIEEEDDEEE